MAITNERLAYHLARFNQSLKKYPERYLPIFPQEPPITEPHLSYLCPLCLQSGVICSPKIGIELTHQFSIDHYPPKSVGGNETLLVCKSCNDKAGYSFDNILKDRMAEWSFDKRLPDAVLPIRSHIEGLNPKGFNGYFRIDSDRELLIDFKRNLKDKIRPLDEWDERVRQGAAWTANVTIPRVEQAKVDQAFLKAAYLYCFVFGDMSLLFPTQETVSDRFWQGKKNTPYPPILYELTKTRKC